MVAKGRGEGLLELLLQGSNIQVSSRPRRPKNK